MSKAFYHHLERPQTPAPLKFLLMGLAVFTLLGALFTRFPPLFGLSESGIAHHFYWQWISYGLFEPAPNGLSFSLFLNLSFILYMTWLFGASLIQRLGLTPFFSLFFGAALSGGLGAWVLLTTLGSPELFITPTPPLSALLLVWALLHKEAQIHLFFIIAVNARLAIYLLIGASILIDLSHQNFASLSATAASLLYAYTFLFLWEKLSSSPFRTIGQRIRFFFRSLKKHCSNEPKMYRPSKIYDIQSGKPVLDDEQFMDSMLTRISLYGEQAISDEERKRMDTISERKRKK